MRLLILISILTYSQFSFSRVRTVEVNDNQMTTITLSLGNSTVLQFVDTPKKVISGNSNYFNIEFSGTDVTIQPLSNVDSNLFIYSGHRRYGFHLKTCLCRNYDDLVKIYWKLPKKKISKKRNKSKFKPKSFRAGKAKIYINQVFYHRFNEVYVISGSFTQPKSHRNPKVKQFWATSKGRKLDVLEVIYHKTHSFKEKDHYRFRVFLKLIEPRSFTFRARFSAKNGYTTILKKDL